MADSIGGVWINKEKETLGISLECPHCGDKITVTAFTNNYKKVGDKRPDFNVLAPLKKEGGEKKEDTGGGKKSSIFD